METAPLYFFLFFGILSVLSAILIYNSKDPRKDICSIFFAKVSWFHCLTKEEAIKHGREVARIVAIIGIIIIAICVIGLLICKVNGIE